MKSIKFEINILLSRAIIVLQIFTLTYRTSAQELNVDSLKNVIKYQKTDTEKINLINQLCKQLSLTNPNEALTYANQSRILSIKIKYRKGEAYALKNIGNIAYIKGDYLKSIEYWKQCLEIFKEIKFRPGISNIENNLGTVYSTLGGDTSAYNFYNQGLNEAISSNDTNRMIILYYNIGRLYDKKFDGLNFAISSYKQALRLASYFGDTSFQKLTLMNLGEAYLKQNNCSAALSYLKRAEKLFPSTEEIATIYDDISKAFLLDSSYFEAEKYARMSVDSSLSLGDKFLIVLSNIQLSNVLIAKNKYHNALTCLFIAQDSLIDTEAYYIKAQIYNILASVYENMHDFKEALRYQKLLKITSDSLQKNSSDSLLFTHYLENKRAENNLLSRDNQIKTEELNRQLLEKYFILSAFAIVGLFAFIFLSQRNRINKEKKRGEELLLNILPKETANELMANGKAKTRKFDAATVLFTDFKNFTQTSNLLSAEDLVEELDKCYRVFDGIAEKYGIEKIKTIGDSFMCAGGIPTENQSHPYDVVSAGIEMQAFIKKNKEQRIQLGLPYFELRCGIHTGPIIAGVVGSRKFSYDIWGATVNTASRMESSGSVGQVNISGDTYKLVKDKFECIYRGKVEPKNIGLVDMYFVTAKLNSTA